MTALDTCVLYLRRHGQAIGEAARSGDARCNRIVDLYGLIYERPDPVAIAMLEVAIERHRRSRATPPFTVPQDDCEHDRAGEQCPDCGMVFVYCQGCSEAGGAGMPIYHGAPVCGAGGSQ